MFITFHYQRQTISFNDNNLLLIAIHLELQSFQFSESWSWRWLVKTTNHHEKINSKLSNSVYRSFINPANGGEGIYKYKLDYTDMNFYNSGLL